MDVLEHFKKIRFTGPFPQGIDVLLVSIPNALDEARSIEPDITREKLLTLLRKNNIAVFNTLEDYVKYKGMKK